MIIHFQLQAHELADFVERTRERAKQNRLSNWGAFFGSMFVTFLLLNTLMRGIEEELSFANALLMLLVLLLLTVSWFWTVFWSRSQKMKQWVAKRAGHYQLTLTPAGIASCVLNRETDFLPWARLIACQVDEHYIELFLRRDVAILIPRRCFESEEQYQVFLAQLHYWWQLAHPGQTLAEHINAYRPKVFSSLMRNFKQSLRVATGLSLQTAQLTTSRLVLFWQLLLIVLIFYGMDYFHAQPNPEFSAYGLLSAVMLLAMWVLAGVFLSSSVVRNNTLKPLLVVMSGSYLVCYVVITLSYISLDNLGFSEEAEWLTLLFAVWHLLVMLRVFQQLYLQPLPSALYLACIYTGFVFVWGAQQPQVPFYYNLPTEPAETAANDEPELDGEAIMYQQPALLAQTLAAVRPHSKGKTDLYFVGFAGEADEKVFSNEVYLAQQQLTQRYQNLKQSAVLLNNPKTSANTPLANGHNLKVVLNGLRSKMDPQEDVLFLFLSSHGARNHELSVDFWPLPLNSLSATRLKQLLDESGIRNRVIVVSACYSGGFLDVLKDEHSLILTASSRDRMAYGCGDYTEYTYFGEAFFKQALPQQTSLIDAFYQAQKMIAAREKQEEIEHAEPQIHIGSQIVPLLNSLDSHYKNTDASTIAALP